MGEYSIALGSSTASGNYSHAEGFNSRAIGLYSHAEGTGTTASGQAAHAEGFQARAIGNNSHAEGQNTMAVGNHSHAEGLNSTTNGEGAHAEGGATIASGVFSHSEGLTSRAESDAAHAEGAGCIASAAYSHAEGIGVTASGTFSHAEGRSTNTAFFMGAHIMGQYGDADAANSWFLANGTAPATRGLAAKILGTGQAYIDVSWNGGGADYAELFETFDGQPIEPGYFVALAGGETIRTARESDTYIIGVVSAAPAFVGDSGELRWRSKYLTDEWGRIQYHEVLVEPVRYLFGTLAPSMETQPILNPQWDPTRPYISRLKRPEWVAVGLMGKLLIRDDGSCMPGGYCKPNDAGIATASDIGYPVLSRTGEEQIRILFR
jgi:hypothetical protein